MDYVKGKKKEAAEATRLTELKKKIKELTDKGRSQEEDDELRGLEQELELEKRYIYGGSKKIKSYKKFSRRKKICVRRIHEEK